MLEGIERKNWVLNADYASGKPRGVSGALISRRPANVNINFSYCRQINSDHGMVPDQQDVCLSNKCLKEERFILVSRVSVLG